MSDRTVMDERPHGYEAFVASKLKLEIPTGIADPPALSPHLFPFQRAIVEWALKRGRAAVFADTGLGKTRMQLEWARVVAATTGKPVLILAPLAVAQQTVREGARLGIEVTYARSQADADPTGITIANYEMLSHFDAAAFSGVVLDESSILKSYMGATKRAVIEAFAGTPFRLACTATPAPNDHLELGNHAEFLGVLTSHEMIARWFINDTSQFGTYRLKGHAVESFWDWVTSWARCCGKPSDVGPFDDSSYVLPGIRTHVHRLDVDVVVGRDEGALFRDHKLSAARLHNERRLTLAERVARVVDIVRAEPNESWCVWCDTDYEADALSAALPEAVEVRGSMPLAEKERRLVAFSNGEERVLITKPKIAGHGLNWQHCARCVYAAPTFSYESDYQSIRRFHRFGQQREVHVHYVMSVTEDDVWNIMLRKARDHEAMKSEMFAAARRSVERHDNAAKAWRPNKREKLPRWLKEERSR